MDISSLCKFPETESACHAFFHNFLSRNQQRKFVIFSQNISCGIISLCREFFSRDLCGLSISTSFFCLSRPHDEFCSHSERRCGREVLSTRSLLSLFPDREQNCYRLLSLMSFFSSPLLFSSSVLKQWLIGVNSFQQWTTRINHGPVGKEEGRRRGRNRSYRSENRSLSVSLAQGVAPPAGVGMARKRWKEKKKKRRRRRRAVGGDTATWLLAMRSGGARREGEAEDSECGNGAQAAL